MIDARQQNLIDLVEKYRQLIMDTEQFVWQHPETGFKEWKTSAYMADLFESLGYDLVRPQDIPGFYTDLDTGRPGPRVLIMGELDALVCARHPQAVNGNAHACGHHAQCAALAGVAAALKSPHALDGLSGSIRLMAVPAEELIEIEYRESLRAQGIIKYFGGKNEFMRRGYFDGVDLAFMVHTTIDDAADFSCNTGCNGCIAKCVTYEGVASHAGGSPEKGINALYAASLGLQAINSLRETFVDEDHIRVHPIVTAGGTSVNIIPAETKLESFVRGASGECIADANKKVNRALAASAAAMGAKLHIMDRPGYSPLNNDVNLMAVAQSCMETISGKERVNFRDKWSTGCTDMGDVSCVMPAIHPYASGASGKSHGDNYAIADKERACMNSAKAQVLMVDALLKDDAAQARQIVAQAKPKYPSIQAFLAEMDQLTLDRDAVSYQEDGSITIQI